MKLEKFFLILIVLNAVIMGSLFLIGVLTHEQVLDVGLRVTGVLVLLLVGSGLISFISGKNKKSKTNSTHQGPQF
ncbi:MAG: hypothetical protein ACK5V3_01755 [Bdellovibrionales bacterium]